MNNYDDWGGELERFVFFCGRALWFTIKGAFAIRRFFDRR
jgi:hypothetical protein